MKYILYKSVYSLQYGAAQTGYKPFKRESQMPQLFGEWILPLLYVTGSALVLSQSRQHWRIARITGALGLFAALVMALGSLGFSQISTSNIDKLGLTAALLVSLLGWVIINYASRYLAGEPHQARFVRAMLFTLATVSLLVLSRNLASRTTLVQGRRRPRETRLRISGR